MYFLLILVQLNSNKYVHNYDYLKLFTSSQFYAQLLGYICCGITIVNAAWSLRKAYTVLWVDTYNYDTFNVATSIAYLTYICVSGNLRDPY